MAVCPNYDINGSANVSTNMYVAGRIGIGKTNPGYPLDINGTYVATTFAGNLAWGYLTSVPSLLSNRSSLGWSNITGAPSYVGVSNTSLSAYSHLSGTSNGGSNQGGLASWNGLSFKCLTDCNDRHWFNCRTGDTSFVGHLSNAGNLQVGGFISTATLSNSGIIASTTLSNTGNVNVGGVLNAIGNVSNSGTLTSYGITSINTQSDTGYRKGLRFWDSGDGNWSMYMCQSGAGKSAASNTACTSIDGRTAHHVRVRAGNGTQQGWLWENTAENCMMSLTCDTGNLYIRNLVQTSNLVAGNTIAGSNSLFGYVLRLCLVKV
jgi:hypothetical protein